MRDIKKIVSSKKYTYRPLLGIENAKTKKGEDLGYITGILYLAPANEVEGLNTCPFASKGCKSACLFTAGRGRFDNVKSARISKTIFFRDHLDDFFYSLERDIYKLVQRAKRLGKKAAVRLNGTSDIRWENYKNENGLNIFELYPDVIFYDYTKDFKRIDALKGLWENYSLTFSMSESKVNKKHAVRLLNEGVNVATVFRDERPTTFLSHDVIDGDSHDLRFLDSKGVIVGLKAKGAAKKDVTGFIIDVKDEDFLESLVA